MHGIFGFFGFFLFLFRLRFLCIGMVWMGGLLLRDEMRCLMAACFCALAYKMRDGLIMCGGVARGLESGIWH